MSASLVRKALDETTLMCQEKLDNLSKATKKRFKPQKKTKKLSKDKLLKQNLKVLKALEHKVRPKSKEIEDRVKVVTEVSKSALINKSSSKKNKSKKKSGEGESVFTEEDFEKFEKEYFVSS